jgi:hypothetical protein
MASKFAIGDKVDQASSSHAEGTVVAIFTDLAGNEMRLKFLVIARYRSQARAV